MKKNDSTKSFNGKRILFVTESLARGGMEKVLVNISNALVQRGFEITILCYDSSDALRKELDSNIRYIYKPRREFKLMDKIPHVRRYFNYRKAAWEHRVSASALYKYYVGAEKYDIEIGFYRGPSIKIVSGSTNKTSKKLAWVHTDFKLCDQRTIIGWFNSLNEAKIAYGKMDNIICVSEKAVESFIDVIGYPEKTTTVYNMIPLKTIAKMSAEVCPVEKKKFTVITVGRLIPDKCQDRLLYAAKKLIDDGYDFDLWIVGGGRSEKDLKDYCKRYHLQNVSFMGMQDNPYKYLKQADLFVLSSCREGFAIVIPEAMACGLPVLSTECTGPTEILKDGKYGMLVPNNAEGIYHGLKQILNQKECLEYYRQQSLIRCNYFDENKIIDEIIDLFQKI